MVIDTHVHLQFEAYATDLPEVLARAAEIGCSAAIIPGTTLADSRAAVELAQTHAGGPCELYAAVGIHPTNGHQLNGDTLAELRQLAQEPRVVAIGEIGLDYYWPSKTNRRWQCATPAEQRRAFELQLKLAAEFGLPVIVHDREAHVETLQILSSWVASGAGRTGTLHAYAGGREYLADALALGFYLGMDGPVTFRKSAELHAVAQAVPLERLLLETDGPYLTPHPYRGQRNEPAYLRYIAARIAELRGTTPEQIMAATTANARRLFGLRCSGSAP
ncbi:MAG: TatD family hydrolase [Chloroflexota bacterium]|nr:TatD family hydrolase [Chloroflexota bacterium]